MTVCVSQESENEGTDEVVPPGQEHGDEGRLLPSAVRDDGVDTPKPIPPACTAKPRKLQLFFYCASFVLCLPCSEEAPNKTDLQGGVCFPCVEKD